MTPRMQIAFRHDVGWNLRLLIARVTGAPCHCVSLHGPVCFDATFDGFVQRSRADRFRSGRWEVFDVPDCYNDRAAFDLSMSRIGWLYDWIGVLWAWWGGRPAGRGHASKLFCSEHCADELRAAGVPLLYARTARYTPRLLRDELRDVHGWKCAPLNYEKQVEVQGS